MSRRVGLPVPTAKEQLQKPAVADLTGALQASPPGAPGSIDGKGVGIENDTDPITFLVAGDTGGVKDPTPQQAVVDAMIADPGRAAFFYHLGDVVYYNGDENQYASQFGEPNAHLVMPTVSIPGNHDGWPDPTITDLLRTGISTWMENFCAKGPAIPSWDEGNEYGRDTQTQPYCDWTLALEAVTIIGLWSNVPSGGHLYASQTAFLALQLEAAPKDRPLIVALHHPPYSIDAHHGGSQKMGDALDQTFRQANRTPNLVLSGHVHDYQRFSREATTDPITYLVSGNGGYHNLHQLAPGANPGDELAPGVTFEAGDDKNWGYVRLTASKEKGITGTYIAVAADGTTKEADSFTC
jgi:3',5'-cyclic AMP phosphodiesterase CpdA